MNINDITQSPITTVSELIDLSESMEGQAKIHGRKWAYRGQPRDYGTLMPSFQREFSRQSFGTAELVERELIDAFRKHYADLSDRSGDMPTPSQIGVGYDLRCLSVMQHYEIPTRLLDWTSDYWTAIYFACTSQPGQKAELWYYDRAMFDAQRSEDQPLESLLSRDKSPPAEPNLLSRRGDNKIVEVDPLITPRMAKQFAHHTLSTNVFADHAPLLYEQQETASPPGERINAMRRILIDGACKSKALQYLAEYKGITASTIFPDVVGLGRYLRWQFESLRTMLL
jgi:hypothetical protein